VKITSDQQACNHKIDCFKFKLFRKISYNLPDDTKFENAQFLSYHQVDGVRRGENKSFEVATIVPEMDPTVSEPLSSTVMTQTFSIDYYMRVYVKYKAIFEVGSGKCFNFPIFIISKPNSKVEVSNDGIMNGIIPAEFDFNSIHEDENNYFQHKRDNYWEELANPFGQSYAQNGKDDTLAN